MGYRCVRWRKLRRGVYLAKLEWIVVVTEETRTFCGYVLVRDCPVGLRGGWMKLKGWM